jgi:ubiquinone/menaquinone biosynthesis C-methylase UbiE
VDEDLIFRTDLYQGTAAFYDRYRPPYPDALIADLVERAHMHGDTRLLDLACGTGQVSLPLAAHCAEVLAVDQEPETVAFARDKATRAGVDNVEWVTGRAEDIAPGARFDLVTIGTAFHRLERRRVAARVMQWLPAGGQFALLWSGNPFDGPAPWQRELFDFYSRWIEIAGAHDRLPARLREELDHHPHVEILRVAGFEIVGRYEFVEPCDWDLESIAGYVYSTSLLPVSVLGDRRAELEADLADRLLAIEPSGRFRDEASYAYDLARRP